MNDMIQTKLVSSRVMSRGISAALALLATSIGLSAELALPAIFSDHMVLQREQAVPVWGTADVGATLMAQFAG
jgi:sialate O-acetylesterase